MLAPGDQIHHYIVEAKVGGGGMATVYRVRHAILQHSLALKVLDPKWVDRPDVRKRFLAEGRIQALVRHPAIVMVTDAVVDAPRQIAGLVMEYVEGPNLAEVVARLKEPPDGAFVRAIFVPLLEALHHAHREGVVHRDMKPSNVLLSRDAAGVWHPRVVDFGIAYVLEEARLTGVRVTDTGRLGTPAFMAPEQIAGKESPTRQWDVFAMGIMLYELATGGMHPFERETNEETLTAILAGSYPSPLTHAPQLDPGIVAAIEAALQPDPADRAEDCAALLKRLDHRVAILAPEPATPVEQAPQDAGPIPPSFVETTGSSHERKAWRLVNPRVRVGREDVEVSLGPVANVEAVHCTLRWDGASWVLQNHSKAGTRVNGARITNLNLEDGDLIRVGHQMLKFHTKAARSVSQSPIIEPRPSGPYLEVRGPLLDPPQSGVQRFPITTEGLVLGRSKNADIRLNEPTCAGKHCRIVLQGLDVVVEDLGSAMGTRVDGQSVRFRRLGDGAHIQIGTAEIRFRHR